MTDNFYITTPIYYVNDKPHIGHAYTSIACDVLARFNRLSGKNVKFLTGTDEHGQKVEKSAQNRGLKTQDFVDEVSQTFRELAKLIKISNDDFIRTTEPRHKQAAQGLWSQMRENGHIYLGSYSGWYSVRDEAYYQEAELVDGKAPTGAEVEWIEEPSYFFDLSKWQDKLLEYYNKNPEFIAPESRRNEIISFVKGGLKDLSISRTSFSWGVPVPAVGEGDDRHIMYVWIDALTNYISALGYPNEQAADYQDFWKNSYSMHMVGKDILRFHAVYWPAFLMAANLPLPKRIFAHGWWTIEGEKMSKSLGNVVAPAELIEEFGLDQTRWFLMREVTFGSDGNFSRERMISVINSELANNIGNLTQRTLSMVAKNCGGKVPSKDGVEADELDLSFLDKVHVTKDNTPMDVYNRYMSCRFNDIMADIVAIASEANNYIDSKAPWKQKKIDERLMNATLYHLLEAIRCIAIMIQPFIPDSSSKILDLLAVSENERGFEYLKPEYAIKSGVTLPPPEPVFPRFVENRGE
ncbi:MAG: methionine--tRNA ligase [Rickettsiales bacterium]